VDESCQHHLEQVEKLAWTTSAFAGSPAFLRTSRVKLRASAAPVGAAAGDATLRYFDGRGVAETARLLFVIAGEKYEDMRYPISFGTPGDFSTLKRDEFLAD